MNPQLLQHLAARADSTLQRALPLLLKGQGVAHLPEHLRALLQAAQGPQGALSAVLQDLPALAHADALPLHLQALQSLLERAELAEGEADPKRLLGALLPALQQTALLAADQQHPQRARLLLLHAALAELAALHNTHAADPAALRDAWERALAHAEATDDLTSLQHAARRQQLAALDRRDHAAAARLAARVRAVAARLGDAEAAQLAALEEASALLAAETPQEALDLLAALPPPPDPLLARRLALQGEALDALHRADDARDAFTRALAAAPDPGAEAAALLGLASLDAEADPDGALLHLKRACEIARSGACWPLYARAALTRAWLLHSLDRRSEAVEALVRGRVTLEQALGAEHIQAFLDTADAFAQDWGGDAFIEEIQSFRTRMR